jgi:hypothetical protein
MLVNRPPNNQIQKTGAEDDNQFEDPGPLLIWSVRKKAVNLKLHAMHATPHSHNNHDEMRRWRCAQSSLQYHAQCIFHVAIKHLICCSHKLQINSLSPILSLTLEVMNVHQ